MITVPRDADVRRRLERLASRLELASIIRDDGPEHAASAYAGQVGVPAPEPFAWPPIPLDGGAARLCAELRPPVLAVEVLSPNDKWGKVMRRVTEFLSRGISVVWLVDPEGQSVTVYRASQLPQVFEGADELSGEPELPGFHCRVADFFYLPGEEDAATPATPA